MLICGKEKVNVKSKSVMGDISKESSVELGIVFELRQIMV